MFLRIRDIIREKNWRNVRKMILPVMSHLKRLQAKILDCILLPILHMISKRMFMHALRGKFCEPMTHGTATVIKEKAKRDLIGSEDILLLLVNSVKAGTNALKAKTGGLLIVVNLQI